MSGMGWLSAFEWKNVNQQVSWGRTPSEGATRGETLKRRREPAIEFPHTMRGGGGVAKWLSANRAKTAKSSQRKNTVFLIG